MRNPAEIPGEVRRPMESQTGGREMAPELRNLPGNPNRVKQAAGENEKRREKTDGSVSLRESEFYYFTLSGPSTHTPRKRRGFTQMLAHQSSPLTVKTF